MRRLSPRASRVSRSVCRALLLAGLLLAAQATNAEDLLIKNARIVGSAGIAERATDILIAGERIIRIDDGIDGGEARIIEAAGRPVSEGWRVAEQISAAGAPVILDPIRNLPSSYETLGARLDNAKLLHEAGVTLMFTGMGWQNTHNAHLVRQSAGNAVANGLPCGAAIDALTRNPATVFEPSGYGAIKTGHNATLVIWSGDPLEVMSNPRHVLIDGREFALTSRATRLRDRYWQRLNRGQ